jgi:hypothetical protein
MSDAAAVETPDAPPTASSEQHQLPAAAPASSSAAGDKAPKRERSGAAKRKRAAAAGGSKPASSGAVLNRELRELEDQLTAILVSPAVPMHMAGDHWPGDHIESRGGPLAHQVVELARRNPAFRAQLQRALSTSENAQLVFAAAAYLLPVLIYYGFIPVPPPVKAQLQVPDRWEARGEASGVPAPAAAAVRSEDGSTDARPGAFTEQPPGTPGAPPAAAPGAAAPSG